MPEPKSEKISQGNVPSKRPFTIWVLDTPCEQDVLAIFSKLIICFFSIEKFPRFSFNSRKASCTINYPLDKVQDINTFEVKAIVNATNEEVVVYSTTFSLAKDPVLTLDKTSVTLEEGKEETVTATVDLEGYTVEWKSSDESIATVENGKIVAKKAGTAVITAQIKDTEVKAEINVTVNTAKAEQPKSGCNAATIIPMLAAFGLVAVFLRRKRLF